MRFQKGQNKSVIMMKSRYVTSKKANLKSKKNVVNIPA